MKTYSIHHEVGIKASPKSIYQALTEVKQLAKWWTSDTRGAGSKRGDIIEFWFGDFCQKFEVMDAKAGKCVRWKATQDESMPEWAGTEITFTLSPERKQCYLHFSHSGWRKETGMFPHCSTKWAVFMLSLKDYLEKGRGHPAPRDVQINHD